MRIAFLFAFILFSPLSFSATIHVPADHTTIQAAIDVAHDWDTVLVAPGTYKENIDFQGKGIVVKSSQGPSVTKINGRKLGPVITFENQETVNSVIDGFLIVNGISGIYCGNLSSPKITNNIIKNNSAYKGGGICIYNEFCSPVVTNNIIYGNWADKHGGGIFIYRESYSVITNNTITKNGSGESGGGVFCENESYPEIYNTIIWNNDAIDSTELKVDLGHLITVNYCNIRGDYPGTGNINSNPCFMNSVLDDYHIAYMSPCINSGFNGAPHLPDLDFEGNPRIHDHTVDMGADEFQSPHGPPQTIHIPSDYAAIQAGIDAALPWDTVMVAPGTYIETVDFKGKAITLDSSHGPEVTIIDGNDMDTIVTFKSGESTDTLLNGFTLTNGNGTSHDYGGGVYCHHHSNPLITNNIIRHCTANGGAGIYCENASPIIRQNTIRQNLTDGNGAGIQCMSASPVISNNKIYQNQAKDDGGGIYCLFSFDLQIKENKIYENASENGGGIGCHLSSPHIQGNMIHHNDAIKYGGGIYCRTFSEPIIDQNQISENYDAIYGAGIYCDTSSPLIKNNLISGNIADTEGGGTYCFDSDLTIHNNIYVENSAKYGGGGIACDHESLVMIINNTLIRNSASEPAGSYGGGVYSEGNAHPFIINSILWDNHAIVGSEISIDNPYQTPNPASLTISHSNIMGGMGNVNTEPGSTLNWGQGMIDNDPLFVDLAANDFHLTHPSPCKDTGDNAACQDPFDFEGDPCPSYTTVDMGADEFHPHLYYTGNAEAGAEIQAHCIGIPGSPINGIILGVNIFNPPLPCDYGLWYMDNPMSLLTGLGIIPSEGVAIFRGTIPPTPPGPYTLYLQAVIDFWLTNLCVVEVE